MILEVVIHRIGGIENAPRLYGPWRREITTTAFERFEVPASDPSRYWLTLLLTNWEPVADDFLACTMQLEDMNGMMLGVRPACVYGKPHDVPTYTSIREPRAPEWGLLSVGMRVVSP